MSEEVTYPESVPPKWGLAMPWTYRQIATYLRKGLTGHPEAPRTKAFQDTLDAVHQLHGRGVTEFRGDKVLRLLIAAAREHGWMKRRGYFKPLPKATNPEHKVCRRCQVEKGIEDFKMLATPAQRKRFNWTSSAPMYVYGHNCAPCRKAKAAAEKRKEVKRQNPDLFTQYKTQISAEIEAVGKVLSAHLSITLPDGSRVYQFADQADQDYYFERDRMLRLARQRFNEYVENGELLDKVDPDVPRGAWYGLLTPAERHHLDSLFKEGSWTGDSYKGRMPTLWERKKKPRKVRVVEDEAPAKVEPPAEVLLPAPETRPRLPVVYDNSEWDIDLTKPEQQN